MDLFVPGQPCLQSVVAGQLGYTIRHLLLKIMNFFTTKSMATEAPTPTYHICIREPRANLTTMYEPEAKTDWCLNFHSQP